MISGSDRHESSAAGDYEVIVGLEVHVQLRTRTKAFCNCSTEYGALPNHNSCPVCLGLPGALPVLNHDAVRLATRAAFALNCTVNLRSVFARKHYFYPDLPKGYQITQYNLPLATDGHLVIGELPDGGEMHVGITRLHLEEDAGKSVHDRFTGLTAIDLNRAGVPLVEIVTEPDLRSPAEAAACLRVLKQLLEYCDVSDVNMEEGSLRVDANVSTRRRGESSLGTKTEVKNMNSFSAVERAVETEFRRQRELLGRGEKVVQQTLLWDAARGEVRPTRAKEDSPDYRYFPDPDLPPLLLTRKWLDAEREALPELPLARRSRFASDYGLGADEVDVLTASPALADYFEAVARLHGDARTAANWVRGDVLAALNSTRQRPEHFTVRAADLARLLDMLREGVVSRTAAAQVLQRMVATGDDPQRIVAREGLQRVDDPDTLARWVDEAIGAHPDEWRRLRAGERKLLGVLVGDVMKRSRGSADPRRVNQLLLERSGNG